MTIPVWQLVAGGLKSLVVNPPAGTGGTVSARYCYSVFLRHRVIAAQYGLKTMPDSVVELGPGDSLGIGLMALLTGSRRYIAIDAVRHASTGVNLEVLDGLVALLQRRAPIPADEDCIEIRPALESYAFPHQLFDDATLNAALDSARLDTIRRSLTDEHDGGAIQYLAPFGAMDGIPPASVDWIFSQAVMEHVDIPRETYRQCFRCLKSGGMMTHQIDFRSHETAPEWNGHWKYPQWLWRVMHGRRPWFVNRLPHSAHIKMQREAGFDILCDKQERRDDGMTRNQLAAKFKQLSEDDMRIVGAMLAARKMKT